MQKICLLIFAALLCVSCEDFLDTQNVTKKDTSNFPLSATDADNMITGVYATLSRAISDPQNTYFYAAELASDERFGGGGENDKAFQGMDHLLNVGPNQFETFWTARYQGIFRANMALETLDNCQVDEVALNRYKGEAHYLRAFFYHELVEMFGEVPLVVSTESQNLPRATADLIYGLIAYDLKQAIALLPATRQPVPAESGHATKWAAEALLARVFLFYTGFYGQTALPLGNGEGTENTGTVEKTEVIAGIDDCIANSGHSLVDDFRRLWPYSNPYTAPEYDFVKDLAAANKTWVLDGHNPEHVFVVKASNMAAWGTITGYSNQYLIHFGLRADNGADATSKKGLGNTFPFGVGWGAGPVNTTLWNEWDSTDPRRKASIMAVADETTNYIWGADKQMEETGYWQKKYTTIRAHDADGNLKNGFSSLMWTNDDDFQLRQVQDLIVIRYADVLLMQSELKGDAAGINAVRSRAGLGTVGYSLDNLKKERRFELAFEGRRWADIRRWGDAPVLLGKQEGVSIWNRGLPEPMKPFGGGYTARYNATKGFFPIPQTQIDLSDGMLQQTLGWGSAENEFQGW